MSRACPPPRWPASLFGPALLSLLLAIGASASAVAADPSVSEPARYEPLLVDRPAVLALASDPRLDPGDEGTIELWLAVATGQPDAAAAKASGADLCLIEHGDRAGGLDWRISLSADTKSIRFSRNRDAAVAEQHADLVGRYHHVAFVTSGGRTQVIVDEELGGRQADGSPFPGEPIGYLPATPEGRPLRFGCTEGPTAKVWISSFRLWGRALSLNELQYTRGFSGPIDGRPDLQRHLLAYSLFTDQVTQLRFPGPQIRFTDFAGGEGGTPFFYRRPADQELAALYLMKRSRGQGFTDLIVEYDGMFRQLGLTDGALDQLSLPTILPRRGADPAGEKAAYFRGEVEGLARALAADPQAVGPEDVAEIRRLFLARRLEARKAALGFTDSDGLDLAIKDDQGQYDAYRMNARFGERLLRLVGRNDDQLVRMLHIESNDAGNVLALGAAAERDDDVFRLALPAGARIEGIAGRRDDSGIRAIALAYSLPDPDAPSADAMAALTSGVWIDRDAGEPLREEARTPENQPRDAINGPAQFQGIYATQPVYRFAWNPASATLTVFAAPDAADRRKDAWFNFTSHTFRHQVGDLWAQWDPQGPGRIHLEGDRIRLLHFAGPEEVVLVRPQPYAQGQDDKLPWGATFSLEHRPNGVGANFAGYFPYLMRARDLQATTGARKPLFRMPADESRDYIATDSRLIVPHGLYFRYDNKGSEQADSLEIHNAAERQSAWSIGLGIHAEIPKVASFGTDGSYQESQESADSDKTSTLLNRVLVTHYALVMDPSRIELEPEFRDRIVELRDRLLTGAPLEWRPFFQTFGTHYAYAVTYGGMAWAETTVDAMDISNGSSNEFKIKSEAKGTFFKVLSLGASESSDVSSSSKTGGGSVDDRTVFGTYGGSFSRGGGWSVGRGEEVPLLLDLRPITALLSPAFFDDPAIFVTLRAAMQKELDSYEADLAKSVAAKHDWAAERLDTGSGQ